MAELLPQSAIAEYLNVDVRQIRNLEKKGLPMVRVKGTPKYPWPAGLHWYLDFKIQAALKKEGGGEAERWRVRTERAKALRAELDLAQRRGELLGVDWVLRQAERWLTLTRSHAMNLGPGIATNLAGAARTVPEVQLLVDRETDAFLRDLQKAIDGLLAQAQQEASRGESDDEEPGDGGDDGAGSGTEDDA